MTLSICTYRIRRNKRTVRLKSYEKSLEFFFIKFALKKYNFMLKM